MLEGADSPMATPKFETGFHKLSFEFFGCIKSLIQLSTIDLLWNAAARGVIEEVKKYLNH